MKNEIFDNMLSRYDLTTEQHKRNAIFEVNQQMILAGLYAGGFFESAAFYGGTCLRIFHGLQRFSEDMDFSLLTQDDKFDFTKYFPAIVDAFAMVDQIAQGSHRSRGILMNVGIVVKGALLTKKFQKQHKCFRIGHRQKAKAKGTEEILLTKDF